MQNETHDCCGCYVLNILIGILNGEVQEAYLLHTKFLQKTNSGTVTQATIEALNSLWTNLQFSKVLLLLTDHAPYMIKAGKNLKKIFPNLLYVPCLVHAFNIVCEKIKKDNHLVNVLISKMKLALCKSHSRKQLFSSTVSLKFPLDVIEIRWHLWL